MGPNVKRLVIMKMAREAIPPGGNFQDGINFLKGDISGSAKKSHDYIMKSKGKTWTHV